MIDRQPEVADRLFETLAADALGQDAQRGQRRAARNQQGFAALPLLDPEWCVVIVIRLEVVGVDGGSPLLGLERLEGPRCLVAPGLLPLELAGLAGAVSRAVDPTPRSRGPRSAISPATNGASPDPRGLNRSPGIVAGPPADNGPRGVDLATRAAARLAPPAGRPGPIAGRDSPSAPPRGSRRCVRRPVAAPAGLHPPRRPAPDQPGEPFRAELFARRRPRPALDRWTPSSSRQRSSGATGSPRSIASTVSATSLWTVTRSRSWISTMTSNVGGALRSSTLFCVRRRRASSSPRVTLWMPPMRSDSVGLSIRLSRLLPWAVPMSWTPRSAIVRAAWPRAPCRSRR